MNAPLDDTDRQLLSLLQANARESTSTLARRLGLARTTVVARIARLERTGVVAGYGVRLGAPMDSAAVRAWCSLSLLPQTAPAVLRALAAMPEVEEVSAVSGQFDYLAFLRCASHERLDSLLDQFFVPPRVFILRMRLVPYIDASGVHALKNLAERCARRGIVQDGSRRALLAFVARQTGIAQPDWLTPEQVNIVVEGLKAMIARAKVRG